MRDYQTKQNKGALPDSITTEKFGAGEFNSIAQELENAVSRSGQTLAPADGTGEVFTQLAESEFLHGVKSQSFQDGGTANTYQLTPISGASGVKIPADYTNLDGAVVTFTPGNASTGASTLDIGQTLGTLLGPKTLLNNDGSAIGSGDVGTDPVEVRYDASADGGSGAWLLQPWSKIDIQPDNFSSQLLHVRDEKPSGTDGGTSLTGTNIRNLNTIKTNEISGASVASDQITLPSGTYYIQAFVPQWQGRENKAYLYNVTDAANEIIGTNEYVGGGVNAMTYSKILGRFTIGATKDFEIRHQINTGVATVGLGFASSAAGFIEVYTEVLIWKVA